MAIGRRRRAPQQELFVAASDIRALDNPFYRALNGLLEEHGFDEFAEEQCAEFYSGNRGRPGVPPGVYFRMLMVGYLEGLGSERGIAWRCADSFSLREFLGCGLAGNPPEHSTLSKTRKRLSVEAHGAVFGFVLERLRESGLLSGRTLGVDATTLEANAAMRTIVRRDDGTEYEEWLEQLAAASGIETPTREDLAKLDRKRPNKGSNKDWEHPHDPEARITKMKDGRTRLAHKLEQAVDMETGAVVAATVQTMDGGDTASLAVTLDEAEERLAEVGVEAKEVVADKGYHSNRTMTEVKERGKRSYVSEPNRGRRRWKGKRDAQKAVYANRRRIRGDRGKRLLRRRGEKVERAFAHMLETGGMRRVHVRGQEEIRKRMLVQAAAFNLGLLMRRRCGFGTPRALQGLAWAQAELAARAADAASAFIRRSKAVFRLLSAISAVTAANPGRRRPNPPFLHNPARLYTAFATHKRRSADALYPRPARDKDRMMKNLVIFLLTAVLVVACSDPPVVTMVTVTPKSATLVSLGETVSLTATVQDQYGDPMTGETVHWSVPCCRNWPQTVATVSGDGTVTAVANGREVIRAYVVGSAPPFGWVGGGVSEIAEVTVDQKAVSVAVMPEEVLLGSPGSQVQMTLEAYDAGGSPIEEPSVTWTSGDEAVATVSATGVVTAVAEGETMVSAKVDEATDTSVVIVDTTGAGEAGGSARPIAPPMTRQSHPRGRWRESGRIEATASN